LRLNNQRVLARDRIMPEVRALIKTFTRDAVVAKLDGTGLPFAAIGRPEDMFDDPHLLTSGGLETVALDDGRVAYLPPLPLEMGGVRVNADAALPTPGRDSDAVLAGLGYDAAAIASLRASGAVG
jgi:crotonobetainyl-CoA:carnitine CoA-transferase CaiB-like acyl-CoA transferase